MMELHRRRWLHCMLGAGLGGLTGCKPAWSPVLKLGAQIWPSYELLHLAAAGASLNSKDIVRIETPSATASMRMLASGAISGACLTLDEVLTARDQGTALTVVAVLDESLGADVVLGRSRLTSSDQLRGKTIGYEANAVGAVMLDAFLSAHKVRAAEMRLLKIAVDRQEAAYLSNEVDFIVTYEPVKSKLEQQGAKVVFSSASIPGRIMDTVAVKPDLLDGQGQNIRKLLAAYFKTRDLWVSTPQALVQDLALRMGVGGEQVAAAFEGMRLQDLTWNRAHLAHAQQSAVASEAQKLSSTMLSAGLLAKSVDLTGLVSDAYL